MPIRPDVFVCYSKSSLKPSISGKIKQMKRQIHARTVTILPVPSMYTHAQCFRIVLERADRQRLVHVLWIYLDSVADMDWYTVPVAYFPRPPNQWDILVTSRVSSPAPDSPFQSENVPLNRMWLQSPADLNISQCNGVYIHRNMYRRWLHVPDMSAYKTFTLYPSWFTSVVESKSVIDAVPSESNVSNVSNVSNIPKSDVTSTDKWKSATCDISADGKQCVLRLDTVVSDDVLPHIAIVTPTRNRSGFFPLALRNVYSQDYPYEKIEWIILDDSDSQDHRDKIRRILAGPLVRDDTRIHYIEMDPVTIGAKRNAMLSHISPNAKYIVHMDDDDIYPPESVSSRIRVLMQYDTDCVGCTQIGGHDLKTNQSFIAFDPDPVTQQPCSISEATLAYTSTFLRHRGFNPESIQDEFEDFIRGRDEAVITMPYTFVILALSHGKNTTSGRKHVTSLKEKGINLLEVLPTSTHQFITELSTHV